jgi:hypothetical protein
LPTVRKTEIQDLSTQVCLTVWASLNDAAPSTTNRERESERDFQLAVKPFFWQTDREELDIEEEKDEP